MADVAEKTESSDRMVLRTVYLPPELDEKLRVRAFRAKLSKGDVIRHAIASVLDTDRSLEKDTQTAKIKSASKRSVRPRGKRSGVRAKSRAKTAATAG